VRQFGAAGLPSEFYLLKDATRDAGRDDQQYRGILVLAGVEHQDAGTR